MLNTVQPQQIRRQLGANTPSDGAGADFANVMAMIGPATIEGVRQGAGYNAASLTHAALTGSVDSLNSTPYGNVAGLSSSPFSGGGYTPPASGAVGVGYSGSVGGGTNVNASVGIGGNLTDQQKYAQQDFLLDKMRTTNMEMIALQAEVQAVSREFQIVSNVLKSNHDAKIGTIRNMRA